MYLNVRMYVSVNKAIYRVKKIKYDVKITEYNVDKSFYGVHKVLPKNKS